MKTRHEVYCSIAFLEQLYKRIDRPMSDMLASSSDESQYIPQLFRLLHQESDLIIDVDEKTLVDLSLNPKNPNFNPTYRKLWKSERKIFTSYPETFKQLRSDKDYFIGKTTELFFLNEGEEFCHNIEYHHGICCINFKLLPLKEKTLFANPVLTMNKKTGPSPWNVLKLLCPPTNSMVLVDGYLLNSSEGRLLNLYPILTNVLPVTLSQSYHLTIFIAAELGLHISSIYDEINKFLSETFSYKIELTLIQTRKENIHDRHLITNRFWINSGHGFDLVKRKGGMEVIEKDTILQLYPITCINRMDFNPNNQNDNSILSTWKSLVLKYGEIFKKTPVTAGVTTNIIGDRINRLFD